MFLYVNLETDLYFSSIGRWMRKDKNNLFSVEYDKRGVTVSIVSYKLWKQNIKQWSWVCLVSVVDMFEHSVAVRNPRGCCGQVGKVCLYKQRVAALPECSLNPVISIRFPPGVSPTCSIQIIHNTIRAPQYALWSAWQLRVGGSN